MITSPFSGDDWAFDIGSLMVLVGENEEHRYRLSQRCLTQSIAAAPVVGLQNYMRSYDMLLELSSLTYTSPSACKTAPLRNMRLENTIRLKGLLKDGQYNCYRVVPDTTSKSWFSARHTRIRLWAIFTWLVFGAIMTALVLMHQTTWIGFSTCLTMTAWSIIVRVIENFRIEPKRSNDTQVNNPTSDDQIFILGRDNSAFVLKGSRMDIKKWTSNGLIYKESKMFPTPVSKVVTRMGSLAVLLFVFAAVPNGSTLDQLAFILINLLGQANTLVGQLLNSEQCLCNLKLESESESSNPEIGGSSIESESESSNPETRGPSPNKVATRTEVYAKLIKRFKPDQWGGDWVTAVGLLPETAAWSAWKERVQDVEECDAHELYKKISKEEREKLKQRQKQNKVKVDKIGGLIGHKMKKTLGQDSLDNETSTSLDGDKIPISTSFDQESRLDVSSPRHSISK